MWNLHLSFSISLPPTCLDFLRILSQNLLRQMTVMRQSSISPGLNWSWRWTDWGATSLNSWSCKWLCTYTGMKDFCQEFWLFTSRGDTFSSLAVLRNLSWRTHRAACSKIYDTEWQSKVKVKNTLNWHSENVNVMQLYRHFIPVSPIFHLTEDTKKSASELQEEQEILAEIMRTVEKRDMLISILEEQRLRERAEDRDLESLVMSKGYEFHWAQADDMWEPEKLEWWSWIWNASVGNRQDW